MRLLVISGRLGIGGAERFVSNLLTFIDRKKIIPSLCLLEDRIDYPLPHEIPVMILPQCGQWNFPQKIKNLRSIIIQSKPDIILSNISLVNRLTGSALNGIHDRPHWIARIGNNPGKGGRSPLRNLINRCWDSYAYKKVDRFVVNSRGLKDALEKIHPCSRGKTTVIYNPIDFNNIEKESLEPPAYQKPPGKQLIIAVGRFHRQKRYDLLIKVFSEIRKHILAELWICGDGYLRQGIEQDIIDYDLKNDAKLLGYSDNPFSLLRQADLYLLTSDWEGMPNSLIEAMGLGVAAVATDCPYGPGEIIDHNVSGLLAEPGNPEDIRDMSLQILQNDEQRQTIASNGKDKVHALFDSKCLTRDWMDFLLSETKKYPKKR